MSDSLNKFFKELGAKASDLINPFGDNSSILGDDGRTVRGNSLEEFTRSGQTIRQQRGFTPIQYYRSGAEYKLKFDNLTPKSFEESEKAFREAPDRMGDTRMSEFRFGLQDFVQFNMDRESNISRPWLKDIDQTPIRLGNYGGTPYDNEDPIYFGFEMIIRVNSSPLFNGEIRKFIESIGGSYEEIGSRDEILDKFLFEIQKYVKTDVPIPNSQSPQVSRKYYLRKVAGLDKLVEGNTSNAQKAFVDYGKDILTLTFYEDVTINLGYLTTLYKLLYWSRLRGKNLIPENLLRFDCEIIVSEMRNLVRLKKNNSDVLESLRSNLSRYRYQLYECQFWFNKMSHPGDIDLGVAPVQTDTHSVEMSFKYSTLSFERYEPEEWINFNNYSINPLSDGGYPKNGNDFRNETKLGDVNRITFSPVNTNPLSPLEEAKKNNDQSNFNRFLDNIKDSAIREAQRQVNIRLQLLNNSLDRIRNSFGIGRMTPPTNVYFPPQNTGPFGNSNFFIDIQRSIRQFAGDVLSDVIRGR
jgi:hypothetical protein